MTWGGLFAAVGGLTLFWVLIAEFWHALRVDDNQPRRQSYLDALLFHGLMLIGVAVCLGIGYALTHGVLNERIF